MPSEYRIHLTPDEAASGTTRTIQLPSGTMTVRVPPALSGRLFKVPTTQGEILIRVEIETDADPVSDDAEPIEPVSPAPGPTQRRPSRARLTVWLVLIVLGATFGILKSVSNNDEGPAAGGVQVVLPTPDDDDPAFDNTAPDDTYPTYSPPSDLTSQPPDPLDTDDDDLYPDPTSAFTPYTTGTCFNGTTAGLTTATIYLSEPVTCVSSDTVYQLIKVLMGTTDTNGCSSISGAYVYTATDTGTNSNGTPWYAVYCLEAYS